MCLGVFRCVYAWLCVYLHNNTKLWGSMGMTVLSRWLHCVCVCVLWYSDMGLASCARVSKAPQAQGFLAHLYDPVMTGKLDTGEDIPLASSLGSVTRLHKHPGPIAPETESVEIHYASHTSAPCRLNRDTQLYKTMCRLCKQSLAHPCARTYPNERSHYWSGRWDDWQTESITPALSGIWHVDPLMGTHIWCWWLLLLRMGGTLRLPLIRLQITEHSTQSTA